jgi:hypothetical protein
MDHTRPSSGHQKTPGLRPIDSPGVRGASGLSMSRQRLSDTRGVLTPARPCVVRAQAAGTTRVHTALRRTAAAQPTLHPWCRSPAPPRWRASVTPSPPATSAHVASATPTSSRHSWVHGAALDTPAPAETAGVGRGRVCQLGGARGQLSGADRSRAVSAWPTVPGGTFEGQGRGGVTFRRW